MGCKNDRVDAANKVLKSFAPTTSIRIDATGHVLVKWQAHIGRGLVAVHEKRWMTRGNDFFQCGTEAGGMAEAHRQRCLNWFAGFKAERFYRFRRGDIGPEKIADCYVKKAILESQH